MSCTAANRLVDYQTRIGDRFTEYAPELMTIYQIIETRDSGGAIKMTTTVATPDVPCTFKPVANDSRRTTGGKQLSVTEYEISFPAYFNGTRINFDVTQHRIIIQERGDYPEPAKLFRPKSIADHGGLYFVVTCEREN